MDNNENTRKNIRCAIYTRKSTSEGLEQDFTTLDAQREAGENYIKSQKSEGWRIISAKYDDGGFTGANMDKPALTRLLNDIKEGYIDCVVVYKVDRLSRSLMDFAKLLEFFESNKITLVKALNDNGYTAKKHVMKTGKTVGGGKFVISNIQQILKHHLYAGKIYHDGNLYDGLQKPIVSEGIFNKVQEIIRLNRRKRQVTETQKNVGLLTSIFRCKSCDTSMIYTYTNKNGKYKYRYYVCAKAIKKGYHTCKSPSINAHSIEDAVIGSVKKIVDHFPFHKEAANTLNESLQNKMNHLIKEQSELETKSKMLSEHIERLKKLKDKSADTIKQLNEDLVRYEQVLSELSLKKSLIEENLILKNEVEKVLVITGPTWDTLFCHLKKQVLDLILKEVTYDALNGTLFITLKDSYLKLLNKNFTQEKDIHPVRNNECFTKKDSIVTLPAKADGVSNGVKNLQFEFKVDLAQVRLKKNQKVKKNEEKLPELKKNLVLAHQIDRFIKTYKPKTIFEVSKYFSISESRIYQIVSLLNLAPSIQESILLCDNPAVNNISERSIRKIPHEILWDKQKAMWDSLIK